MARNHDYLNSILSDNEKAQIASFAANEVQKEAVKKVLLAVIYGNGTLQKGKAADPLRNFLLGFAFNDHKLTNEEIGADLRGQIAGINLLEVGFDELEKYAPEELPKPKAGGNPAR